MFSIFYTCFFLFLKYSAHFPVNSQTKPLKKKHKSFTKFKQVYKIILNKLTNNISKENILKKKFDPKKVRVIFISHH